MSAQTYVLGVDSQLESFLNAPMFDSKPLESYLDSDLDSILNTSPHNTSFGSPDSPLHYGLFDYNQIQNANNVPLSNPGAFETGHVDPSLVIPQPGMLNGGASSTCLATSISVPQNGTFTAYEPSNAEASAIKSAINPPITENQNANGVKKRRSRRKKAPLPPAVKEEKRRVFLAKNRIAASKCREKNRQKWERIQEQCVDLEAQNKVLKERCSEMNDEMESLRKLIAEHRQCGNKEISKWIEEQKTNEVGWELHLERGNEKPSAEVPGSSRSANTRSAQDHSENFRSREVENMSVAADTATTLGTQNRVLPAQDSGNNNTPTTQGDFSTSINDFDMISFIQDDEVPALSPPSSKTSAASSDFEATSTTQLFSSPTDSAVDLTTDIDTSYGKVGMEQTGGRNMNQDEILIPDTNIFSMCDFTGQQTLPETEPMIW